MSPEHGRRAGKGGVALRGAVSANADEFARSLAPVIAGIRVAGYTSLHAIAAELNDRGIELRRGGTWHVSNVRNLLTRLDQTSISGGLASDISGR